MPRTPKEKAVALKYDGSLPAPVIIAQGTGRTANRMEQLAAESSVPVVRNELLVDGLELLSVGDLVPPQYWELMARVLLYIRNVRT